jgi:hypothetical protein
MQDVVNEHRARDGYLDAPQSFIDVFLSEIDKNRSKFGTVFTGEDNAALTFMEIFVLKYS